MGVGAVTIAGSRPVPASETTMLGFAGSLVFTVRLAVREPPSDGLKRTVKFSELPAPMVVGSEGGATIVKSPALVPVIGKDVTLRLHEAQEDWLLICST